MPQKRTESLRENTEARPFWVTRGQLHTFNSGESTPTAFAPTLNPTNEDPEWPLMLDLYFTRLVSAVQEWSTCAHSTPSLPDTVIEQRVAMTDGKRQQQHTGSSHSLPHNCSDTNRPVNGDPILSNRTTRENRAICPHDTSVDSCPGDREMPPPPKDNRLQSPVTITNTVALPDRQSPNPPTARLAQLSDPPDEDPNGPKRVAVSERYQTQNHKPPPPNIPKENLKTWPWHKR